LPRFRVFETDEFLRKRAKLPPADASFIQHKTDAYVYPQLREDPFYGPNTRKLPGYAPNAWRYRIGKVRLFYAFDTEERVVYVLSVDLRRDAYR